MSPFFVIKTNTKGIKIDREKNRRTKIIHKRRKESDQEKIRQKETGRSGRDPGDQFRNADSI